MNMKHGKTFYNFLLFIVILFLLVPSVSAESASTTYTFDIDGDGGAWYIMEYRVPLDTQEKIDQFEDFKTMVEGSSTHRDEFEAEMRDLVFEASYGTSRPMTASDFDVSVKIQKTLTGKRGYVKYSFKWTNFAKKTDSTISVGDVLFGGQDLLEDDAFVIKIPDGYKVSEVSPTPDIKRSDELVWNGPRTLVLDVVFEKSSPWFTYVLLLLLLAGGGYYYTKKNDKGQHIKKSGIRVQEASAISDPPASPPSKPEISKVFESEEDVVASIVREHGGAMMQSELVKKTGFSKSKISTLLNKMDKAGRVQRIKKGRENMVRLN